MRTRAQTVVKDNWLPRDISMKTKGMALPVKGANGESYRGRGNKAAVDKAAIAADKAAAAATATAAAAIAAATASTTASAASAYVRVIPSNCCITETTQSSICICMLPC